MALHNSFKQGQSHQQGSRLSAVPTTDELSQALAQARKTGRRPVVLSWKSQKSNFVFSLSVTAGGAGPEAEWLLQKGEENAQPKDVWNHRTTDTKLVQSLLTAEDEMALKSRPGTPAVPGDPEAGADNGNGGAVNPGWNSSGSNPAAGSGGFQSQSGPNQAVLPSGAQWQDSPGWTIAKPTEEYSPWAQKTATAAAPDQASEESAEVPQNPFAALKGTVEEPKPFNPFNALMSNPHLPQMPPPGAPAPQEPAPQASPSGSNGSANGFTNPGDKVKQESTKFPIQTDSSPSPYKSETRLPAMAAPSAPPQQPPSTASQEVSPPAAHTQPKIPPFQPEPPVSEPQAAQQEPSQASPPQPVATLGQNSFFQQKPAPPLPLSQQPTPVSTPVHTPLSGEPTPLSTSALSENGQSKAAGNGPNTLASEMKGTGFATSNSSIQIQRVSATTHKAIQNSSNSLAPPGHPRVPDFAAMTSSGTFGVVTPEQALNPKGQSKPPSAINQISARGGATSSSAPPITPQEVARAQKTAPSAPPQSAKPLPAAVDLDRNAVDAVFKSLSNPETGLLNHGSILFFLVREFNRFQVDNEPFSLVLLEMSVLIQGSAGANIARPLPPRATRAAVQKIFSVTRQLDLVAHYEEKDFAILLPITTRQQASEFARNMVKALLSQPLLPDMEMNSLVVRAGIACFPEDTSHPGILLAAARDAKLAAVQSNKPVVLFAES